MIDGAAAKELSQVIDAIRQDAGVPRDFDLKFNPSPPNLKHVDFVALKQKLIETCGDYGVKLIVYAVLHSIAKDRDLARRNGINTVAYHFDCILNRIPSHGLVLIDRFNDKGNEIDGHLKEKFSTGLKGLPYSSSMRLNNIVGYHYSTIGQSHFPSLVDIILGSLRFAINAHTKGQENAMATAGQILTLLKPLFWTESGKNDIPELSFVFSPKVVGFAPYLTKYQSLKDFLIQNGLPIQQKITNERMY